MPEVLKERALVIVSATSGRGEFIRSIPILRGIEDANKFAATSLDGRVQLGDPGIAELHSALGVHAGDRKWLER